MPESFGNLRYLKNLDLSYNKIKKLPESFGNLSSVEYIDLSGNKLESLPETMEKLKSLKKISLNENPIWDNLDPIANKLIELWKKKRIISERTSMYDFCWWNADKDEEED